MSLTIGVDVGGTKVAAGVVDESGAVLEHVKRSTPSRSPGHIEDTIAEVVTSLRAGHDVEAVGIGAAGWIGPDRAVVLFAPNLAWRDEPLRDEISKRVGLPVVVENDANATAWAEYRFGAGRGEDHLVTLTLGTGIGCGIVLDGTLYRGRWGIGGEPGHMRVVPDGRPCGCGNLGCWEQYSSGPALVREARAVATSGSSAAARLLELAGGAVEGIDGPIVMQAAREGDPLAVDCFRTIGTWLGQGMADLAAVLDPGRFVVGGGVSEAGDLLLGPARERYAAALSGRGHRPLADIVQAETGANAGLIGAADLARHR